MNVEHVVVLMLENNSFDRMLGSLPGVDGVDSMPRRSNRDSKNVAYPQGKTVTRRMGDDPHHDLKDVLEQMKGPCEGFVRNFERNYSTRDGSEKLEVMAYYDVGSLPVLHRLGQAFAVCDRWFSSMPGPTWPNRFFVHSGTSLGHVLMPEGVHLNLHLWNQNTVYDRLQEQGRTWAIYFGDAPQTLAMTHMWKHPWHLHKMDRFFKDAKGPVADFPEYSFIEPSYFGKRQNDQHPPSDMMRGEALLAQVYNAIRGNQALWEKTLLVVLYDEHGGFYDHVFPPACVAPDDHTDEYRFNQLGLRVPAVLISPWLESQVISDVFDHTSLLRYVSDMWGLGELGARTAAASSFASSWKMAAAPRTDVPVNIAEPAVLVNPEAPPNPNQLALIGLSQFLETKTMAMAAEAGPAAARAMTLEVGERALRASARDLHGEVAVERFDRFLELARESMPAPVAGGRKGGAKVLAKKAAVVPAKKKGVNPLVKVAAKAVAKKAAGVVAKKAVAAALKKAAKKTVR